MYAFSKCFSVCVMYVPAVIMTIVIISLIMTKVANYWDNKYFHYHTILACNTLQTNTVENITCTDSLLNEIHQSPFFPKKIHTPEGSLT